MREAFVPMKSPFPAFASAALFALSACNSQPSKPEVIDSNPDPMATELANRAPVALPPSIKSEKTFRCKDQSLIYVTFFQGGKQVVVRTEKGGSPTTLLAPAPGDAFVAEGGWTLTGDEANVTVTKPGKAALTCHV